MKNNVLTNLEAALALARDRKAILLRLQTHRASMAPRARRAFGVGFYDSENMRMTGDDGTYLEWRLRRLPNEPEGPNNQQHPTGTVLHFDPKAI